MAALVLSNATANAVPFEDSMASNSTCAASSIEWPFLSHAEWSLGVWVAHRLFASCIVIVMSAWSAMLLQVCSLPIAFEVSGTAIGACGVWLMAWVLLLLKPSETPAIAPSGRARAAAAGALSSSGEGAGRRRRTHSERLLERRPRRAAGLSVRACVRAWHRRCAPAHVQLPPEALGP